MNIQQIKTFSNGIKAVLSSHSSLYSHPDFKPKYSVLQLFDKDGKMLAQREICDRREFNGVMDKLTIKSSKESGRYGTDIEREVINNDAGAADYTKFLLSSKNNYEMLIKNGRSGEFYTAFTQDPSYITTGMERLKPENADKLEEVTDLVNKMRKQWF